MIREINKREALRLLADGKNVYFLDVEKFRLADLSIALDGLLIAEVPEEDASSEDGPAPSVPVRISETMTVEAERAPGGKIEKPSRGAKQKIEIDMGKIKACREAGRTIAWIADEMGVSQQTIRNRLADMGMK